MTDQAKPAKRVDLSEYEEERRPFDEVIRQLGKAKTQKHGPEKAKAPKVAAKRSK